MSRHLASETTFGSSIRYMCHTCLGPFCQRHSESDDGQQMIAEQRCQLARGCYAMSWTPDYARMMGERLRTSKTRETPRHPPRSVALAKCRGHTYALQGISVNCLIGEIP